MKFSDIFAQDELKQSLITQIKSNKFHHAHLFIGKMGYQTFAIALATIQYLYCSDKTDVDSCGLCSNCIKIQNLAHLDIHFTFPNFEKEPCLKLLPNFKKIIEENEATFDIKDWLEANNANNAKIRSDEMDNIINKQSMYAYENGYKTQVIWYAEYMEKESNKLLKILEEPTENGLFILIAESTDDILPTILSRCNIHKIKPLNNSEMRQYLQQKWPAITDDLLSKVTMFSEGNSIEARRYLNESSDQINYEELLLQYLRGINGFSIKNVEKINLMLETSNQIAMLKREEQKKILEYLLYFIRQIIIFKVSNDTTINDKLKNAVEVFANKLEIDQLELWTNKVDKYFYYIEGNANSKISFVSLAIEIGRLMSRKEFEYYNK